MHCSSTYCNFEQNNEGFVAAQVRTNECPKIDHDAFKEV